MNGIYYGKKQLDEVRIDSSDLYSNSKYWMKQYYKYNFDQFINRLQQDYYKKYIYQSLYYSIKFEDTQEVTAVRDFL
jgi:ribonuclease HI